MVLKDELREQFNFFRRHSDETKKEYKRRIRARGQELLEGKNCTIEDSICFKALYNCRGHILIMNSEQYALRKGTAQDYEKYVDLIFFEHLDEEKFQSEKEKLYDEFILKCNKGKFSSDELYFDYRHDKPFYDEYLEQLYAKEVRGKVLEKKRRNYYK